MFALILRCNYVNNLHPERSLCGSLWEQVPLCASFGCCWEREGPNLFLDCSGIVEKLNQCVPGCSLSESRKFRPKFSVRAERSPNNNQVLIILWFSKVKVSSSSHRKSSFEIRIDFKLPGKWGRLCKLWSVGNSSFPSGNCNETSAPSLLLTRVPVQQLAN